MATEQSDPQNSPPAPAPVSDPPAPPAPPPAAAVVIEGKTPREIELEQKLEEESRQRKGHELTIAQLREETHQLRQVTPPPPPPPVKKKGCLEAFLEGED